MRVGNKKEIRKASCICTADWHLRDTQPKCRTDNYYEAQWKKISFISELQVKHNCPVLIAGDVFDKPKPSPMLLADTLLHIPRKIICVPGQHDLPEHSIENLNQSGLAVLNVGSDVRILKGEGTGTPIAFPDGYAPGKCKTDFLIHGVPWGKELLPLENRKAFNNIALIHTLVRNPKETNENIPFSEDYISLFEKMTRYDLIVSGDNHKSFTYQKGGKGGIKWIVNPGSLMRMDADQVDHKPRMYLWYAEDNTVEAVYLPIEQGVVSREHIERQTKEDERMEAYKTRLKAGVKIGISFEKNMKRYLLKNKVKPSVEKEIYAAMEGGKK